MSNRLYETIGKFRNPYAQLTAEITKFAQSIKGNPQQLVQQLLNSGEMSQTQYNNFARMAEQIAPFMAQY